METTAGLADVAVPVPIGRWLVDPGSSTASFAVRNFGLHTVRGIVPIREATAVVAEGHRVTAVHAVLNLAGIDTANTRRDKDLRAPRLLDTGQFPELVFDATDSAPTTGGWRLNGTLTAHGVTIPITLDGVLAAGPTNGGLTIAASTRLDRRDLAIKAPSMLIGHEVLVEINARFRMS
ncbi:MAG: YceI family protein [Nakamurella sp.]